MDKPPSQSFMTRYLGLRVTKEQFNTLTEEADQFGYEITSLMRLRLFGKVKALHIIRRPSYNTRLLGDAMGRLISVSSALNQNGSNLRRIAERLNQNTCDLFGLDGALHRFDQLGQELLKILNLMDVVIKGRPERHDAKPHLPPEKGKAS